MEYLRDLLQDPASYWFRVPADILNITRRYVSNIEGYLALPVRGLKYPRGQKPQVARLKLISRVVLEGPSPHGETWLWVMDMSRDNQLILRNIDNGFLTAYDLSTQTYVPDPLTEWDRLDQSHIKTNCQNICFDILKYYTPSYSFPDPITQREYKYDNGKLFRQPQDHLVLRTHLLYFRRGFINLQGQLILVHEVWTQTVSHLPLVAYPFPVSSLVNKRPVLIVSIYQ